MAKKYDVVVVGSGHNGLITAAYLAKAGLSVCVLESNERAGGGTMTMELTVPGFKHDICSVAHTMIQANPLIKNDELGLKSKYGLNYINPECISGVFFDDGSVLEFYSDMEKTCQSIAKFSQRDAEAYRVFNKQVWQMLDMLVMGMFNPAPGFGAQAAMMDQSPEGREMLRAQAISAWDFIDEWFEHDKVKIALARYSSEAMTNPFDHGTGMSFYIILPYMHKYGSGLPVGGSGKLPEVLIQCIEDHAGTIKVSSPVKEFKISGSEVTGVVLTTGEEILANKAVVSSLNVKQVFPDMLPGAQLPDGFVRNVRNLKHSTIQPFTLHMALNEMPKFKVPGLENFFWVEKSHASVEGFARTFRELEFGNPKRDFTAYTFQHNFDKSRVPEGKHLIHIYAFQPYNLKDGGAKRWDDIGQEVADAFLEDLRAVTTNMGDDNILGKHFMTPLDFERKNPSMMRADITHLGTFNWQLAGNRPVPGWAQYRMPLKKFYMTGSSTHPGGGVTGGSGRNAAMAIMEDLGIDFEKLIK